jgi:hypothetical protein
MLKPDPKSYPPLGMSREDAAHYVGIGPTLFDEMVRDRRMPRPKCVNNRKVWDQEALRLAFKALPGDEENTLDALFAEGARRRG